MDGIAHTASAAFPHLRLRTKKLTLFAGAVLRMMKRPRQQTALPLSQKQYVC